MDREYRNFDEVEAYIGLDAANLIRIELQGLKLYLPQKVKPKSPLAEVLGIETAQELCNYMGGDWLRVPSGKQEAAMMASREMRQKVRQLRALHVKVDDIASQLKISDRYVYMIMASDRKKQPDPNQITIFDMLQETS